MLYEAEFGRAIADIELLIAPPPRADAGFAFLDTARLRLSGARFSAWFLYRINEIYGT